MRSLLVTLFILVLGSSHLLSNFEQDFVAIHHLYKSGQTSEAFSRVMRIFVAVNIFEKQFKIKEPLFVSATVPQTCHNLLEEIAKMGIEENWVQNFQEIFERMKKLHSQCTNMDFKGSTDLKGFDNKCALCTIITKVMENYIFYHDKDVTDFIQREFCDLFDGIVRPTCEAFVHYAGPYIIKALEKRESADAICLGVGFCINPNCRINGPSSWVQRESSLKKVEDTKPAPWEWLNHIFVDKFGNGHLPPFDLDNDTFGDISTFRGYNWRGSDCDEFDKNIYPGRKTGSNLVDHDCNGIFGLNPKTGKLYEHELCANSKRFGLAVIGDSAGAHFSIPQKFLNASLINKGTYNDLLARIANQLDIPHESGYTGNTNTQGYVRHSVYKYLREWNLCNNNDYQNIAVNGGKSGNTWGNIKALIRDKNKDYPLLMFMELIGNDVCSKSLNGMTKPEIFKENILKLLNYLDQTVPTGSHLIMLGLAEGQILYDNLHDDIHPLNVTFSKVYDFLNCLNISPCWSWLNSNETVRQATTQRARQLSAIYREIINDGTKFRNFDMTYYDFPTMEILERRLTEGGDPKDMIERCDGFHPNGLFHSYLGDWLWRKLQEEHADWIGEKNPHNEQIRKIFNLQTLK